MANNKGRRAIGAIVVLIGAILLIVAAFMPWYTIQASGYGNTITQNSYPGIPTSNGTIQYSCSGSAISCPSQTSYHDSKLDNTGNLAEAGYFMAIVGFILGLVGAILGIASRGNSRRAGPAVALAIVAMLLAIVAVGMFAGLLPGALKNDLKSPSGSGPWSSFFGSANQTGFNGLPVPTSDTWGPGAGWYIAIAAFIVLLIGAVLILMSRKDAAPAPVTTPAPTSTSAPAGVPPSSPPSS